MGKPTKRDFDEARRILREHDPFLQSREEMLAGALRDREDRALTALKHVWCTDRSFPMSDLELCDDFVAAIRERLEHNDG